jgi:hypothetical protein
VSDFGLDDRTFGVRSPAEVKDFFSSLCVQTGSRVHPASCQMGTRGSSPGLKSSRGVTLTTHPHLVSRSRMSRSYNFSPPSASMACSRTTSALAFSINIIYKTLLIFVFNNSTNFYTLHLIGSLGLSFLCSYRHITTICPQQMSLFTLSKSCK